MCTSPYLMAYSFLAESLAFSIRLKLHFLQLNLVSPQYEAVADFEPFGAPIGVCHVFPYHQATTSTGFSGTSTC